MTAFTTYLVIGLGFAALVVYDVLVAVFAGNDATISKCMQRIGQAYPIVVVFWGGLAAHFFFPKAYPCEGAVPANDYLPLVYLALGFLTFAVAWQQCSK